MSDVVARGLSRGASPVRVAASPGASTLARDPGDAPAPTATTTAPTTGGNGPSQDGGSTAQGGQAGGSWVAPFELGPQSDTAGASAALVDIKGKLDEWKDVGFDAEMKLALGAVDRALKSVSVASRPLTSDEVTSLTAAGLIASQAHRDALSNFQAMIAAELDKYTGVAAEAGLDAIAEQAHAAFMGKEAEGKLTAIKEVLGKSKELGDEVKKYVGYAEKAKSFIKAAEKLTEIKKGIGEFNEKLESAEKIADLAESVLTLAGKVNETPGEMAGDIGKFRATFKLIDFAISKSKVPVIGQMWDGYIKPCAELAFKKLEKLDDMIDQQTRLSEDRLDEWWSAASKGMAAPSITESGLTGVLLDKYFVGGQPMLDFMWSLYRGGEPQAVPSGVEQVFIKFRSQFNEGEEDANKIETDTKWYNPSTWFGQTHSPNLLDWVKKNKDTVWAMLYGKMPHP
jgi:hypothetical protein